MWLECLVTFILCLKLVFSLFCNRKTVNIEVFSHFSFLSLFLNYAKQLNTQQQYKMAMFTDMRINYLLILVRGKEILKLEYISIRQITTD